MNSKSIISDPKKTTSLNFKSQLLFLLKQFLTN